MRLDNHIISRISYKQALGVFPSACVLMDNYSDSLNNLNNHVIRNNSLDLMIGNNVFNVIPKGFNSTNSFSVSFEDQNASRWLTQRTHNNTYFHTQYDDKNSTMPSLLTSVFADRLIQENQVMNEIANVFSPYSLLSIPSNFTNKQSLDNLVDLLRSRSLMAGWCGVYNQSEANTIRLVPQQTSTPYTIKLSDWQKINFENDSLILTTELNSIDESIIGKLVDSSAKHITCSASLPKEYGFLSTLLPAMPGAIQLPSSPINCWFLSALELHFLKRFNRSSESNNVWDGQIRLTLSCDSIQPIQQNCSLPHYCNGTFNQWSDNPLFAEIDIHGHKILCNVVTPTYVRQQEVGMYIKWKKGDKVKILINNGDVPLVIGSIMQQNQEIESNAAIYLESKENIAFTCSNEINLQAEKLHTTGDTTIANKLTVSEDVLCEKSVDIKNTLNIAN